ncbi:MAG: hypothetical protein KAG97_09110, partial [Victivallales bacterium]|nr:hypothetical protein [Victivallales bacterium]
MNRRLIVAALCITLASVCCGELTVNKRTDENGTFFDIKNEFFAAQLSSLGGRIYSLKSYPSGKELLYVDPGHGGSLDDRAGRAAEQYDFKVLKDRADEFVIRFSQKSYYGLKIEKTITISGKLPAIQVAYKLINESKETLSYLHMIRHFIAAKDETDTLIRADTVYYHDTRGLQEIDWPAQFLQKTLSEWYVTDHVKNWQAVASRQDKVGIVYFADKLEKLYFWSKAGSCGFGTLEPSLPPVSLPPGGEEQFKMLCVPFEGLGGISSATEDYLSYLKRDVQGLALALTTEFHPLSAKFASPQAVQINTEILNLNRESITRSSSTVNTSLKEDASASDSFRLPKAGEYIVRQELKLGNTLLGSYETPVSVGLPDNTVSQYRHPSFVADRGVKDYSIAADDFAAGYLISPLTDSERSV